MWNGKWRGCASLLLPTITIADNCIVCQERYVLPWRLWRDHKRCRPARLYSCVYIIFISHTHTLPVWHMRSLTDAYNQPQTLLCIIVNAVSLQVILSNLNKRVTAKCAWITTLYKLLFWQFSDTLQSCFLACDFINTLISSLKSSY